mmetsp:Transcript_39583/g.93241  ORF Transcript_39583/g.93241 Transcript_39583/m.93241 type:complete len:96 (-) Transcript_39583:99-386(-)
MGLQRMLALLLLLLSTYSGEGARIKDMSKFIRMAELEEALDEASDESSTAHSQASISALSAEAAAAREAPQGLGEVLVTPQPEAVEQKEEAAPSP